MRPKIPQLDSIRGIAILVVMLHNATRKDPELHLQRIFNSGWMGVDLFFVLSGFLISGILLDAKQSPDYFKNFYARRILRIWPLYYLVLFLMFVVIPLTVPRVATHVFGEQSSPWWSFPLFLQSILLPYPDWAVASLGVAWSLSVEEQFYLVWPWLVRYCSQNRLRVVAVGVICISPLLRLYLTRLHVHIYSNLFCRLDGLMAGALLACLLHSRLSVPPKFTKLAWIGFGIGAPLALATDNFNNEWFVHSLAVLAAVSFIYLALACSTPWFQAVLANRFLVYTGSISYGLYLLHKIPIDALQMRWQDSHMILILTLGIGASYALAALSWYLVERPFLRLKRFFPSEKLQGNDLAEAGESASPRPLAFYASRNSASRDCPTRSNFTSATR